MYETVFLRATKITRLLTSWLRWETNLRAPTIDPFVTKYTKFPPKVLNWQVTSVIPSQKKIKWSMQNVPYSLLKLKQFLWSITPIFVTKVWRPWGFRIYRILFIHVDSGDWVNDQNIVQRAFLSYSWYRFTHGGLALWYMFNHLIHFLSFRFAQSHFKQKFILPIYAWSNYQTMWNYFIAKSTFFDLT